MLCDLTLDSKEYMDVWYHAQSKTNDDYHFVFCMEIDTGNIYRPINGFGGSKGFFKTEFKIEDYYNHYHVTLFGVLDNPTEDIV